MKNITELSVANLMVNCEEHLVRRTRKTYVCRSNKTCRSNLRTYFGNPITRSLRIDFIYGEKSQLKLEVSFLSEGAVREKTFTDKLFARSSEDADTKMKHLVTSIILLKM